MDDKDKRMYTQALAGILFPDIILAISMAWNHPFLFNQVS